MCSRYANLGKPPGGCESDNVTLSGQSSPEAPRSSASQMLTSNFQKRLRFVGASSLNTGWGIYKDDGNSWLKVKNPPHAQAEGRQDLFERRK